MTLEKRKSNMTEKTLPLSESPSESFKAEDDGEADTHPFLSERRASTKSLHSSTHSLSLDDYDNGGRSQLRIHRIRAHKRLSAPEMYSPMAGFSGSGSDHTPSAPRRRGSHDRHQLAVAAQMQDEEEDDTMRDEDDDDSALNRTTPGRKLSDSERRFTDDSDNNMRMPLRKSSSHTRIVPSDTEQTKGDEGGDTSESQVASDSQNQTAASSKGSSIVTDEAIENMILSQIPEHIRSQMTPEMWKQIFTVNTISKHTGATSVCSELTDDLASKRSRKVVSPTPTQRHSINHAGSIEDVSSPSSNGRSDVIKENLESHSTFRTFVTEDSKDVDLTSKASKDAITPASIRSTSSTKDEETNESTASPQTSPIFKRRSLDSAPKSSNLDLSSSHSRASNLDLGSSHSRASHKNRRTKRPGRRRSTEDDYQQHRSLRRSEEWNEHSADFAPAIPKKKGSIRSERGIDDEDSASASSGRAHPSSGRRVPKKRQYSVRFCPEAYIRNHERILEIHPSTSSGPSVGLGWGYYESTCKVSWCSAPNKRYSDMLLSRQVRERIVRVELGYTPKQIAKAIRENLKIKNQRRRTVNNLAEYGSFAPVEKVEYTLEKIQRKLGKLAKLGRKSSSSSLKSTSTAKSTSSLKSSRSAPPAA